MQLHNTRIQDVTLQDMSWHFVR